MMKLGSPMTVFSVDNWHPKTVQYVDQVAMKMTPNKWENVMLKLEALALKGEQQNDSSDEDQNDPDLDEISINALDGGSPELKEGRATTTKSDSTLEDSELE